MKVLRVLLKVASLLAGLFLLWCGLLGFYIAVPGIGAEQALMRVISSGFIAIAAVLLVFRFSRRIGKLLAAMVLVLFATGMLWLAFAPDSFVHRPPGNLHTFRIAATAFAGLLAFRLWTTIRRPMDETGT